MRILHELSSTDALADVKGAAGAIRIDPASLRRHAPERHAMMLDERGGLLARCSWWTGNTPPLAGQRVGVIGHYAAVDAAAGTALVDHACARLADAGCTLAVGPMDGNTWRPYRFVIDDNEGADHAEHAECGPEPTFFFEPNNPADWPSHFTAAGFSILAMYTSALNEDLSRYDSSLDTTAGQLAERGITIRAFDPAAADAELRRIFTLSLASFGRNYLYTPLDEAEFFEEYRSVLPAVCPELVLLAERQHELVGFLFALPDLLETRRPERIIIKTVAVAPGIARAGLGSLLTAWAEREAHRLGYRRAIHALMHERNASQHISRRSARTIRRYALFARALSTRAAVA